ncbi:hypothetical protein [Pseudokineococcus marinus]|uniref:PRC-barrel domain-containing protein n=1 Tax=Pseudokineococcus marinus TaxID=351215 RepID=A0A849BGF5_9ACTN|nr:hypothetical protein [Pseudokineococcus marinus]NNH22159.1 hypothetical protein [Pseudokineococcus marinus]
MPVTEDQAFLVVRAVAVDRHRQVIGPVTGIYYDDHTGAPAWVSVRTPAPPDHGPDDPQAGEPQPVEPAAGEDALRLAPLAGASYSRGHLHLDLTYEQVAAAPPAGDDGHLDAEHEVHLYRHYGLSPAGDTDVDPTTASTARSRADQRPPTLLPPAEA